MQCNVPVKSDGSASIEISMWPLTGVNLIAFEKRLPNTIPNLFGSMKTHRSSYADGIIVTVIFLDNEGKN